MTLRRGVDYLAGLGDGRDVWLHGKKVDDIAGHPELGPFARAFAEVFDWQHEPEDRDLLTTCGANGERVSRAYDFPRATADLVRQREMFELLDRRCGGVMGRFPQHMAVVLLGLYAVRQQFACVNPEYPGNVERYLAYCRDNDLSVATGFTDPQRDRMLDASVMEYLRIVERRSDGIVIRGAKGVATVAPYADEYLGLVSPRPDLKPENMLYFALPVATEGLKIVCREPFAGHGQPADHPLSAVYDEMDAWIVFDDVFVPWERVFFSDRADMNDAIFTDIPAAWGYYSTLIRAIVKIEAIAGICFAAVDYLGIRQAPHVEPLLAEVLTHLETLRLIVRAAEDHPVINDEGLALPDPKAIMVGRIVSIEQHGRMLDVMRELCGTSMLMSPGGDDLDSPELGPVVRRYLAGGDPRAPERFKLMKLAWDFANGAFAARQLMFEQHNSGSLATNRRRLVSSIDPGELILLARHLAGIDP